jgi:hypothetical protein
MSTPLPRLTVSDVLALVDGVRRSGSGYAARCGAHEDGKQSLSISEGDDGRVLLYCHAGCSLEAICTALDIEPRQLFPAGSAPVRKRNGAHLVKARPASQPPSEAQAGQPSGKARVVSAYPYTDESGALLYEVVRFDPKDFRQRRPDGNGGHHWSIKDVRRVLYRLPSVVASVKAGSTIWLVEGEKDADNLAGLGLTATTSVMGAGKWRSEYTEQLRGAGRVVIIPDKDEPGRKHAAQVANALAGVASDLRILELPGPGKDTSEWLAATGNRHELEHLADLAPAVGSSAEAMLANGRTTRGESLTERNPLKGTNLHQLAVLLESTEDAQLICGGELQFDEMNLAPCVGGVPFDEAKYLHVQRNIEQYYSGPRNGSLQLPKERVRDAIHLAADKRRSHPVREYLMQLKWDGVERISSVLEEVLGLEPTELSQAIMRAWFISAAARPMQPGCKADHVLILVGPQNLGKSSFFVELAGAKWFSDSVIDITNRDSYLLLRRIWILEWSELEAMQRARHQDAVKAFITSRADMYRAPYARATESVPRTSIIVGTTNGDGFLTDATGNRRYWPIRVTNPINLKKLAQWRNQLWAEALVAFQRGERWWLTAQMEARLHCAHEEFEQEDPWTEKVLRFAQGYAGDVTTARLLEDAVDKPAGQWTRSDEMRVAAILTRGGWAKERRRSGTKRAYCWHAPTNGWDRGNRLGQKTPLISSLNQPSQPSLPVGEEEEEEVTARTRARGDAVSTLSGDVGAFDGPVRTARGDVQ